MLFIYKALRVKPVLFAVSAEGLVNPTVTSTVLIIIALMHIGIAPAVSKLISPIGVYPSGAVTGTLKSADFQAPKFIVPLVLFILSKLCESLFKGITEFENTEPKGSLFIYQKRKRGKRICRKKKQNHRNGSDV